MNNILHIAGKTLKSEEEKVAFMHELVSRLGPEIKTDSCAPLLAGIGWSVLLERTGIKDPFRDLKHQFNSLMLSVEERTEQMIEESPDPLEASLVASGTANLIDFGAFREVNFERVVSSLHECIDTLSLDPDTYHTFLSSLEKHKKLLIMADNCGEIVLDKILVRQLQRAFPGVEITCAMRAAPVLNDATVDDALEVGLDRLCKVVSSGSTIPGFVFENSRGDFRKIYENSPVILSKGGGNFESAQFQDNRNFFLFIVKCDTFSEKLNVPINTLIFQQGRKSLLGRNR
jgi:hypothetical protein